MNGQWLKLDIHIIYIIQLHYTTLLQPVEGMLLKLGTGNGERGTGNVKRGTRNGSLGTSVQR